MKEWTGQVAVVSSKDFHGVKLWSFQLNESQRWFRMGKREPDIKEGEWVTFQEKNSSVEWSSLQGAKKEEGTPVVAQDGVVEQSETVPATNVSERIQYQAARADACRIVVAALHTEHLPHAANIAKGKRLDLLLGYVDQVTKTLLEQENNNGTQ